MTDTLLDFTKDLRRLVCRPACQGDTADVLELDRTIWDGDDYIPYVWQEWLADPQGQLAVAQFGDQVVGIARLCQPAPRQWWMEGLRVHPDFQDQGIAGHLFDYLLKKWEAEPTGPVRLATASTRIPVHRICARAGFSKVGEYVHSEAAPLADREDQFTPISPDEASALIDRVQSDPAQPLLYGLMDLGWQWVAPHADLLRQAAEQGRAWRWRNGEGLLFLGEDDDQDQVYPQIETLCCPVDQMVDLLTDYRRLVYRLGCPAARWVTPEHPELKPWLARAGFFVEWPQVLYIFERRPDYLESRSNL